ncbi:MAG: hypothetical protein KAX49_20575, partial [Halanaerobiales bacterium]|nr:hypothetical protein [Halanaerobiales bacterium]
NKTFNCPVSILINVPIFTVFQHIIPDEFRGRFFGTFNTFTQGLIPIAYLISGLILGIGPVHLLIFVGGSAILLLALGLRNNEEIKNIKLK